MTTRYIRNPNATVVTRRRSCLWFVDGRVVVCEDVDVDMFAELLVEAALPRTAAELADVASKETIELLVEDGVLVATDASSERAPTGHASGGAQLRPIVPSSRVVVGVTGAVASLMVAPLLLRIRRELCRRLDVIVTDAAQHFVRPDALTYIDCHVWADVFAPAHDVQVPHVHLAEAADLLVVLPASAATLHKLASGTCSDLLSLVACATAAPVVVAPSMNPRMWSNPAVQRNVATIREDGMYVVEPGYGFEVSDGVEAEAAVGGLGVQADALVGVLAGVLTHASRTA